MPLRPPSSTPELVAFVIFAVIAVIGAIITVAVDNPIRCAVGLFLNVTALAGLYLNLGAQFLGIIQLIVYAGAVVVLFVFVIMLLGPDAVTPRASGGIAWRVLSGVAIAGGLVLLLVTVQYLKMPLDRRPPSYGTLAEIGKYIFIDAVVPFEFLGVTLTVAVIGAFAVARGRHQKRDAARLAGDATKTGHVESWRGQTTASDHRVERHS